MFKFKMLTKVLVAVLFFGQLIELNVNLCIALSIERARPINRVKLYKSSQFKSSELAPSNQVSPDVDGDGPASAIFAASRHSKTSSKVSPRLLKQLARQPEPQLGHQPLESTGTFDYFGEIRVGEPEQSFMVLFDITSSRFWLPAASCKSEQCISRRRYNSSESATYKAPFEHSANDDQDDQQQHQAAIKLNYGNVRLEGNLCRDRVKIANFQLEEMPFVEATQLEGEVLGRMPVDGFFGLGFHDHQHSSDDDQQQQQSNATSFASSSSGRGRLDGQLETPVELMAKHGLIEKPVFSLYLNGRTDERFYSRHSGDLILGQIDQSLFFGELTYVPIHSHPHENYWEFKLDKVHLHQPQGDTTLELACESGCPAIVRTGVKIIGGHRDDVDRINRQIGGIPSKSGIYFLADCDSKQLPNLVFNIGGNEFQLGPEDYIATTVIRDQIVECYSTLQPLDAEQYPFWVLGEPFLRRHYIVFDYGEKQIGLAPSKQMNILDDQDGSGAEDWGNFPKGSVM